jgi:hypothetical protein
VEKAEARGNLTADAGEKTARFICRHSGHAGPLSGPTELPVVAKNVISLTNVEFAKQRWPEMAIALPDCLQPYYYGC